MIPEIRKILPDENQHGVKVIPFVDTHTQSLPFRVIYCKTDF